HRSGSPIGILDWNVNKDRFPALYRRRCQLNETVIELISKTVVLLAYFSWNVVGRLLIKELRNIDRSVFRMRDLALTQFVDSSDHFVHSAKSEHCHQFAYFVSDETHIVDYVPRLTGELCSQLGILSSDANRTGVAMAFAQHDAAQGYQGRGAKPVFFGPEQGR